MNKLDIAKLRKIGLLGAGIGCTIGAVLTGITATPKGTSYQYWSDDKLELMMTDTTLDGLECTIISFNIDPDII